MLGVVVACLSVAAVTGALYGLKSVAPVVSLGVVYLVAVLVVSAYWGLWLGLATSLLSAAAFNFFHLPPVGRFTIADSRNWVALGAFVAVALVTSTVSELARARAADAERRRREADLAAAIARALLADSDPAGAYDDAAELVAGALGIGEVRIRPATVAPEGHERAIPLLANDGQIATLIVAGRLAADVEERLTVQVVPVLAALTAIAMRREELQTEAVETEALRRSDDLKTALLRSVSHDLRTPLTAMLTAGHALGSPSLTEDERRDLSAAVVAEGETLTALVDKLLDLSRLQAGRAEPRLSSTSIEEVLATAAAGRGEFQFALDPDLPALQVDATQLERAFANVLENAARHSGGHPVQVRGRVVGSRLVIRIVDRGPGVPESQRSLIFEPFYRAPGSQSRHQGAGLGLAIAKGFVEANGGRISVESLPGQGTSFVIEFPLALPAGSPA